MDFEEEPQSMNPLGTVSYVFANYGWYIFILLTICVVLYYKTLKSYIDRYKENKFEKEYAAKYHKNPDLFSAHVSGQQRWAEKLQEQYNKDSEAKQMKLKEREEKRREDLIAKYGGPAPQVSGKKTDEDKKKQTGLKPEYNPLMSTASSSNYRPPKRSACGGGGCGR